MSISGNLSGISFAGIGSGIDTASIVQQLMQIEAIPVTRMKANQARIEARLSIYEQLSSKITALRTAAAGLNSASAFNPVTGSVSDSAVASVSVSSSASVGTYSLRVKNLARAHKVMSTSQTDATSALNLTGDIVVNGKLVSVSATDSLSSIASKINASDNGVVASVLGGTGGAYVTLTSKETGAANKIQVSDSSGTVLSTLGFTNGSMSLREPVTDGFRSFGYKSATDTLSNLTGSIKSGSFQIGSQTINVDFASDTLSSVASKINAAFAGQGLTASVVDATVGSKTVKKLEVTGLGGNTLVDTNGVLADIGVLAKDFANQAVEAKDAEYVIDGVTKKSYSNSVSDVVSGVTITLLKDETQGTATTTIDLSRDNGKIKEAFKNYKDAFNGLMDYVKTNTSFDAKTFESGPLFGDSTTNQVVSGIQGAVFQQVRGTGSIKSLADVGFGLDEDGKLTLDESMLDKALANNIDGVRDAMMSTGSTTSDDLLFLGSTSKTQDAGVTGYQVNITRAATIASTTASSVQTLGNRGGEVLTFAGTGFATSVDLTIDAGKTLADIVAQVNSHADLKDKVSASIDGSGKLKIESKRYGSSLDFTVRSNLDAAADTTGIGTDGGVYVKGYDVEGTINGEAAVGSGQFLTGKDDNANTAGLQIQYKGTAIGDVGLIHFSRGVSNRMLGSLDFMSDPVNGLLTSTKKELQEQVEDLTASITSYNETLAIREQTLKNKFLAMERAIAQLQSQQAQLSKITG